MERKFGTWQQPMFNYQSTEMSSARLDNSIFHIVTYCSLNYQHPYYTKILLILGDYKTDRNELKHFL